MVSKSSYNVKRLASVYSGSVPLHKLPEKVKTDLVFFPKESLHHVVTRIDDRLPSNEGRERRVQ